MHTYTHSQVIALQNCVEDPSYFIEQYCVVEHPHKGLVKMILTPDQRDWIESCSENKVTSLGELRQTGKSQFIAAYALWLLLFSQDHNIGLFVLKHDWAKFIRARMMVMYEHIPSFLRCKLVCNNQSMMIAENGSRIYLQPISERAGRGCTINTLLLDGIEYTTPQTRTDFLRSILPVVFTTGAKIVTTGTLEWQA